MIRCGFEHSATYSLAAGLLALAVTCSGAATAQTGVPEAYGGTGLCGPLENHYGPFDYRKATREERELVERFHFTPAVESLRGGASSYIGDDLSYILRVFPNHHRALSTMVRLYERSKGKRPEGIQYLAECYFDRAIRFTPDDAMVRVLYGFYLMKGGRAGEARRQFVAAEQYGADDPQIQYNLGLAYCDLKEYDRALAFAHKAYDSDIKLPGLRDKLKRAGAWR